MGEATEQDRPTIDHPRVQQGADWRRGVDRVDHPRTANPQTGSTRRGDDCREGHHRAGGVAECPGRVVGESTGECGSDEEETVTDEKGEGGEPAKRSASVGKGQQDRDGERDRDPRDDQGTKSGREVECHYRE